MMEFQETKPIYLQIADKIMDDIMSGAYPEGGRLPSVREYAAQVEVNANTVMRTYDHLSQRGMIFNRRGIGFFVEDGARALVMEQRRNTFFDSEARYFMGRLASFGVTPSELSAMYDKYLSTNKES